MKEYMRIGANAESDTELLVNLNAMAKKGWVLKTSTVEVFLGHYYISHWLERDAEPKSEGTTK